MPYGVSSGFSKRKKRRVASQADLEAPAVEEAPRPTQPKRLTSSERYGLFARLAWLTCYSALFAAEQAGPFQDSLPRGDAGMPR